MFKLRTNIPSLHNVEFPNALPLSTRIQILQADIAVSTVIEFLSTHNLPEKVIFCCFESNDASLYRAPLTQ